MKSRKAFTLFEILIVVALVSVVLSAAGLLFSGVLNSSVELEKKALETEKTLSLYNQISKQLFSSFAPLKENFRLEAGRLSFYTLYPVFYRGGVRAEYIFNATDNGVEVVYQEFPYPDGKLGENGTKELPLGVFKSLSCEVFDGKWLETFKGDFTGILKLTVDNRTFYVVGKRK